MLESFRNFLMNLAEQGDIPSSFKYGFVINAMICALLIGPILGGIGTMVVTKKMAFFSEAVGHADMTGDSSWCTTRRTFFGTIYFTFYLLYIIWFSNKLYKK